MRDATVEIVAGSASGLICTLIGHPLDCVKVRQQADAARGRPTSTAARAARMLREEGVQAFARGVGPPLVNAALMNSLMFVVFAECRRMLPDNAFGAFASGAIAGVATATLSTPFDYLKIQAQVRGSRPLAVLGATRPGVLFRGHAMNMLREGVFTCVYLGSYDAVRSASFGEERPPRKMMVLNADGLGHPKAVEPPFGRPEWAHTSEATPLVGVRQQRLGMAAFVKLHWPVRRRDVAQRDPHIDAVKRLQPPVGGCKVCMTVQKSHS